MLTARELEVLDALRVGARSYREIAAALEVSVHTAEAHVRRIATKIEGRPGVHGTPLLAALSYALTQE